MNLSIKRSIDCNNYSVVIKFKSWGGTKLTPEEEMSLVQDYCPKFKISDIEFKDNYTVEGNKVSQGGTDEITLVPSNRYVQLNDELEIEYSVHLDEIKETEVKTQINTKDLVCKAKIELFVDKIVDKIKTMLEELTKKFDDKYEYEVEEEIN